MQLVVVRLTIVHDETHLVAVYAATPHVPRQARIVVPEDRTKGKVLARFLGDVGNVDGRCGADPGDGVAVGAHRLLGVEVNPARPGHRVHHQQGCIQLAIPLAERVHHRGHGQAAARPVVDGQLLWGVVILFIKAEPPHNAHHTPLRPSDASLVIDVQHRAVALRRDAEVLVQVGYV